MNSRSMAALVAALTAVAVIPVAGTASAAGDERTVLTNSGLERGGDTGHRVAWGSPAASGTGMQFKLQLPLRDQTRVQSLMARGAVFTPERLTTLVREHGLDGIEIDHQDHDATARGELRDIVAGLDVVVTGSSDYHGAGKPNRLGENSTSVRSLTRICEQATSGVEVRWP